METIIVTAEKLETAFDKWAEDFKKNPHQFDGPESGEKGYGKSAAKTLLEYID